MMEEEPIRLSWGCRFVSYGVVVELEVANLENDRKAKW
jgi:hypothetical protein